MKREGVGGGRGLFDPLVQEMAEVARAPSTLAETSHRFPSRALTARIIALDLQLLQYNTIISASQYAQYYFSLRNVERQPLPSEPRRGSLGAGRQSAISRSSADVGGVAMPSALQGSRENFRSKYFMTLNVPAMSRLQEQTAAVGRSTQIPQSASGVSEHLLATSL